jgi:TonB family protein
MIRDEALAILELSPHATAEERSVQYETLRRQLEDKLAKAPTPGLREKYRSSLKQLEDAFAGLAQTDDSAALPVANRQSSGGPVSAPTVSSPVGSPLAATSPSSSAQAPTLHRKSKSGGSEFALVAAIAVVVLAGGGWFVMKTRAENAEQARVAAEQKAAADRQAEEARVTAEAKKKAEADEKLRLAAAEKTQQEQLTKQLAALKSRFAELNIAYDAVMRSEALAERELADLKSELRSLSRESANAETRRQLEQKIAAHTVYLSWLRDTLPAHPASVHRARAASLLESRSTDEAAKAIEDYTLANQQLRKDHAAALDYRDAAPVSSSATLVQSTDLRILRRGTLDYPAAMLRREMEGLARISCVVQADGRPTELQIVEATTPEFGNAALKYVATFTFAPASDANGKPVASRYSVPVRFKLN